MNTSPSPSPRRPQRPRPTSPLAYHTRPNDDDDDDDNGTKQALKQDHGRSGDRGGFYQISLSDDPTAQSNQPAASSYHKPSQSYSQSHSSTYNQRYDHDGNYGYHAGGDYSGASISSSNSTAAAHRPVSEYHNAFSNVDGSYAASIVSPSATTIPPPSSASASSSPTSHFATFSSASRSFLQHRRQQSIPNLFPSIQSIGRNLGRAISPERSLRPSQPSRPPIPVYKEETPQDEDDEDDSTSSDEYSDEDDDSNDDSENEGAVNRSRSTMAPFTGDSHTARQTKTYTSYTGSKNTSDSPSVASGLTNWLSGGGSGTPKTTSPDRAYFLTSSRTTTPEPSNVVPRGVVDSGIGHTSRRSMSLASDASATPRSSIQAASSTSPSRFSQLTTSMTATLSRLTQQKTSRATATGFENDEFYNLDVDAALFPAGYPSERDAFSPSAYKNLEANATGALRRLQAAYRQRAVALSDVAAEKSVRDEELEEAEIRAQHLKMQLEGMARRADDQQKEMEALMDELAAERKARAQERAMLLSGVPMTPTAATVIGSAEGSPRDRDDDQATSVVLSEDLGVDEAQRDQKRRKAWRRRSLKSDGSSYDDTDEGDEGSAVDEDESSSSVFSRSRSPTFTPSINFSLDNNTAAVGSDGHHQVHHPRVAALGSMKQNRSVSSSSTSTIVSQLQPMSTFQKLMKNVTAAIKDEETDPFGTGASSCRNCRGQDVSFAWNTVSVLRDENKHLKQRVGQLEVAVEGALDMVNGVGLL